MKTCRIHITGLEPQVPVNLFTYAALTADKDPRDYVQPENFRYATDLITAFSDYWSVTSYEDADVIVYAHPYKECAAVHSVAGQAKSAGKKLVFLESSESEPPTQVSYGLVFRQSIFGSQRKTHEHACASMHNDILSELTSEASFVRPKEAEPSVGFCGYVGTSITRFAMQLTGQTQKVDGLRTRARVLHVLSQLPGLRCDFIRRNRYLGLASLAGLDAKSALQQQRKEFLDNLSSNPYGVAVRGKGNHSVRFFELLSAGRIPIFINTNCVLPFEDQIDYRKHVVWIEYSDIEQAGSIINDFHSSISDEAFSSLQRQNRSLWEEYLSPLGFHRKAVSPPPN